MKSCPTCNRTFEDTFTFCLIDGSVLSAPYDPAETRSAARRSSDPPPTEVIRAPAHSAESHVPLQSTIHAAAPQVPDLHQPTAAASKQSGVTITVPLLFRLPLAARGILAVVCILPWLFLSGGGRPWHEWYPPLAGILAVIAGAGLYARHKAGHLLILEGIVALFFAAVIISTTSSWWYWQAAWPIVSGMLTVAAAFALRKHLSHTWLLATAGLIFATYTLGAAKYSYSQITYELFMAVTYLQAGAILLSGLVLTAFSLLTRGKQP